jgi:hypothetical protein
MSLASQAFGLVITNHPYQPHPAGQDKSFHHACLIFFNFSQVDPNPKRRIRHKFRLRKIKPRRFERLTMLSIRDESEEAECTKKGIISDNDHVSPYSLPAPFMHRHTTHNATEDVMLTVDKREWLTSVAGESSIPHLRRLIARDLYSTLCQSTDGEVRITYPLEPLSALREQILRPWEPAWTSTEYSQFSTFVLTSPSFVQKFTTWVIRDLIKIDPLIGKLLREKALRISLQEMQQDLRLDFGWNSERVLFAQQRRRLLRSRTCCRLISGGTNLRSRPLRLRFSPTRLWTGGRNGRAINVSHTLDCVLNCRFSNQDRSVFHSIADQRQLSGSIALLRENHDTPRSFSDQSVYDLMRTPIDEQLLCPTGFHLRQVPSKTRNSTNSRCLARFLVMA